MPVDILKRLVDAACAMYRVTDRLPDDPIVRMLKESALTTIASCVVFFYAPEEYNKRKAQSDLHTLCSYFFVVKKQEWIDGRNFDVLLEEYTQIRAEVERFFHHQVAAKEFSIKNSQYKKISEVRIDTALSDRQKKIFTYAQENPNGEISLKELRDLFPDVAYRTVQRDVQGLLERKMLGKRGTTHNTTYHLFQQ